MPQVRELLDRVVTQICGTPREGQLQMAEAVASAFSEGRHLLVQAGTGTGKSLGYLVPAMIHAAQTQDRVIVATATLALQRQLLTRDLPLLESVAAELFDYVPNFAVVKGRANYACLHRVREGAPDDENQPELIEAAGVGAQVVALREWAEDEAQSLRTGDKDDAPPHTDQAWRQVSVSSRECLGASRCPLAAECFAERAKAEAQDASIVVTNHALLSIDAIDGIPMLPPADLLVVDEAHELVARITQASTIDLDPAQIERTARSVRAQLNKGSSAPDHLSEAAESLADVLAHISVGRIDAVDPALKSALELVRDSARSAISELTKADSGSDADPDVGRQQAKGFLDLLWTVASRMAAPSQTEVLWLGEGTGAHRLHLAPVDIASALQEKVFDANTVILTSATLLIGGSFVPIATAWGLTSSDFTALDVGSPFDYRRQAMLYVAAHLPAPSRDGLAEAQLDEIAALVKAAGGRTLGLFSSRRAAEVATAHVRAVLPELEIWCQGEAQLSDLTGRFAREETSSLFGTLSLWQGMDLPGPTCSLVIIDKIPFPRPDDPVLSARQRLAEQRGRNGFMEVAAQHAALLLAQGAGRLVRRTDDRGVVALLDPRIVTARYGTFLAGGLPPMWRTTERSVVLAALRRLDASASTLVHGAVTGTR